MVSLQLHGSDNGERNSEMKAERGFLTAALVIVAAAYFFSLSVPLFGDTVGYGVRTVNWTRDNGYPPVPSGEGKGEQAMGHPVLFFWLWALLTGVLGNALWVARILPAVSAFFCLWGMYRLGKHLAGETAGWLSALALVATPLFYMQMLRAIPESAVVAAVIWSTLHYVKKKYLAAALFCTLAVLMREQAVILAGVFFLTELLHGGLRKPGRLLLMCLPLLGIAITGFGNLIFNGYFFFPAHLGTATEMESGWLLSRIRLFGTYLIASEFRWLPVTVAVAGMLRGFGRNTFTLPFAFILLFPALFYPPERLVFLVFIILVLFVYLLRERKIPGRVFSLFLLMPAALVLFLAVLVKFAPLGGMDLYRYLMPALPFVILGPIAMLFRHYSPRTALVFTAVFIAATAVTDRSQQDGYQFGTDRGSIGPLVSFRDAVQYAASTGDTILTTTGYLEYLTEPVCGAVTSPCPARDIQAGGILSSSASYSVVCSPFTMNQSDCDVLRGMIPEGSSMILPEDLPGKFLENGVEVYRIECNSNP